MHLPLKKKKKAVIKLMVQNLQLMVDKNQRTTGSPLSSCELLFKLRRLNYLEVHQCYRLTGKSCLASEGPRAPDF